MQDWGSPAWSKDRRHATSFLPTVQSKQTPKGIDTWMRYVQSACLVRENVKKSKRLTKERIMPATSIEEIISVSNPLFIIWGGYLPGCKAVSKFAFDARSTVAGLLL